MLCTFDGFTNSVSNEKQFYSPIGKLLTNDSEIYVLIDRYSKDSVRPGNYSPWLKDGSVTCVCFGC